jgi:5'-nucleotidase / UDP-sugar diphosphatase
VERGGLAAALHPRHRLAAVRPPLLSSAHRVHFVPMRPLALILLLATALAGNAATRVTLLQFSDYHSHALPFYSEERPSQGGMARAVAWLRAQKRRGALVFSGGDMINKGSPSWSDKYGCVEWPWLNGIVDAMAFGNHDADYGREQYELCAKAVSYPILSANTEGFRGTAVFAVHGVRIGVLALAGNDFKTLVKSGGFVFNDPVSAAREAVRKLRDHDHVDAVVMIGHEHMNDDFALARSVPGIDVILGSHSHLKRELQKIPGTSTWFLSPYQYLTYVSRVQLTIDHHRVTNATGSLVRIDARITSDPMIARRVARMQLALEHDPQYAPLFLPIATLPSPMSVDDLGNRTVAIMREVSGADLALSTVSTFRQPLAPGTVTMEGLLAAMPYENEIVVAGMSGADVERLLALVESKRGSDAFAFVARPAAIDPSRTYRVAATDFMARVAVDYRDLFKDGTGTGLKVREEVRKWLATR